jgi:hypothetical protein
VTRTLLGAALLLAGISLAAAQAIRPNVPPPTSEPASEPAAAPEPAPEINQAQQLVFMNDLMRNVPAGSALEYRFTRHGKDLPDYQDRVIVTVTGVADDGRRDLTFDFLSAGHHLDFHPATAYTGNPVPIQFLERDIKEMAEATEGDIGYFRNRLRRAFANPQVQPVKITLGERTLDGIQVTLVPFADDPNISHYQDYANKRYDFLFSEQVPGGLYQIRTLQPAPTGQVPVLEEQLTFDHTTPGN